MQAPKYEPVTRARWPRTAVLVLIAFLGVQVGGAQAQPNAAAAAPATVLIIDDSNPDASFGRRLRAQIHSTLDREVTGGYALYAEFLNLGASQATDDTTLRAYVGDKHHEDRVGVIVALGSTALEFSLRLRFERWPDVPIVFLAFDSTMTDRERPPNSTGVIAARTFDDLVKTAKMVVPELTRATLVGAPINTQPYRPQYEAEIKRLATSVDITDLTGQTFEEIAPQISTLPVDSVVIYLPMFRDVSGSIHNPMEAVRIISRMANRPVVVDNETLIGEGGTGGIVLSADKVGNELAQLAARVLKGERASDIALDSRDLRELVFDARELERWDISENTLPTTARIMFKAPNAWDLYRFQILGTLGVVLLQGIIIGLLLHERQRRHLAETESRQHLVEMTQMDRALTVSAMSSSIAHELNQPLTAILSNAQAASMLLDASSIDRRELKDIVDDIRRDDERAAEIIDGLRMLLRRKQLDTVDIDLPELIKRTISLIGPKANEKAIRLETDIGKEDMHVRADYVHIQQVLLNLAINAIEAVTDAAPADRLVRVQLRREHSNAVISVSDCGGGIPKEKIETIFNPFVTTKSQGTGLGLSIARTIVATYGGRLWAENGAPHGAIFSVSLGLIPASAGPTARDSRVRAA